MARRLGPLAITLIVIDVVLIGVLVFLLVTAPDGPDAGDAGASVSSTPTSASEEPSESDSPSSTQAVTVPAGALDVAQFVAPSRNIWCVIDDAAATCQIAEIQYQPPAIEGCEGNDLAGHVLTVTADGAEYPCPQGDIGDPTDWAELGYGQTTAVGDFMCTSAESGVTCTNLSTAARFSVARAEARLS